MAVGVPETDVFAAADAVLARGERPTVERVRIELGRGSPARVGQLLEQWWERLAQRLKGQALLPDLPGEAAQAFAEVWRLALEHAETSARTALTEEQNALFAAQTTLTQERKLWELALAEAQAQLADAVARATQAELQRDERQALVDQLGAQRSDLMQQRDRLQAQGEQHQADLDALRTECMSAQEYVRRTEDHAHQRVDQTRQELKTVQHRLEREQLQHSQTATHLTEQLDELRTALRSAEHAAARQAGQVTALEAALSQLRRSPTTPSKRPVSKASRSEKNTPRRTKKPLGTATKATSPATAPRSRRRRAD
jgi:hypothetical protein